MKITSLRRERLSREWTLEYVANSIGITNQSVSLIETGQNKPSYDVLLKLCKLFNVPHAEVEQLFAVADDKSTSQQNNTSKVN